jgi:hypothetical protein
MQELPPPIRVQEAVEAVAVPEAPAAAQEEAEVPVAE